MSAEAIEEPRLAPGLHIVAADQENLGPEVMPLAEIEERYIPSGFLNVFGQQRPGSNQQQEALTKSLRVRQLYAVDVVMASAGLIEEYRQFTNQTWGTDKKAEDLRAIPSGVYADKYAALIAGHSRNTGLRTIAEEDGHNPDDAIVRSQIHQVNSVYEILSIQLAENIHSQPPKDRTLRGVAEMFLWLQAQNNGRRLVRSEFAKYYGVSDETVRDAINYVALPPEIRRLTDDGELPVGITIELARARQAIFDNALWTASRDPAYAISEATSEGEHGKLEALQRERAEELVRSDMLWLMGQIFKLDGGPTKNIGASRTKIREYSRTQRERNAARQIGAPVVQQELEMVFETVKGTLERQRTQLRKDLEDYFSKRGHQSRDLARRIISMENITIAGANEEPLEEGLLQDALV